MARASCTIAFSPDGKILLTRSHGYPGQLWEAATGKPLGKPLHHPGWLNALA
jgi:hypothetical protein